MSPENIQAVLDYKIIEEQGTKFIKIPLELILTDAVKIVSTPSISLREVKPPTETMQMKDFLPSVEVVTEEWPAITIPAELQAIYRDADVLTEDVVEYLKTVASSWEFHNSEFKKSILKKAAASRPALNGAVFRAYGKEGDEYLSNLVKNNKNFIQAIWKNGNKD